MSFPKKRPQTPSAWRNGAERNIEKISILVNGETVHTTVSFGIADATGLTASETLIEHADEALYAAKVAGRNKIATYDETKDGNPGLILPILCKKPASRANPLYINTLTYCGN